MATWKSRSTHIDPDAVDPLPLWLGYIPLEIVAHHPGVAWRDLEQFECAPIHARIGFAEPHFTFDEDRIEVAGKIESIDLASLHLCAAVGQQRQPASLRSQPLDGVYRVVERLQSRIAQVVVRIANSSGQRLIVQADILQRKVSHLATSGRKIETSQTMALGIGPVPMANTLDRHVGGDGIDRPQSRAMHAAGLQPAGRDAAAVVEDRVVEVEKNGARKLTQATSVRLRA